MSKDSEPEFLRLRREILRITTGDAVLARNPGQEAQIINELDRLSQKFPSLEPDCQCLVPSLEPGGSIKGPLSEWDMPVQVQLCFYAKMAPGRQPERIFQMEWMIKWRQTLLALGQLRK
jgi:hypothetical protein